MLKKVSFYFFINWILTFFVLVLTGLLGAFLFITQYHIVDFSALEQYQQAVPTILLDDQGVEWARFCKDKRDPIAYHDVPACVVQAFVAAEDWHFFNHGGISLRGILRSLCVNLYHGKKMQGASTITQQLVKLLFLDSKKTFSRKIKEQLYAILIEYSYTKEQILQAYLNNIYFGCGIYGIEAAAQRFWAKHATDLTIQEAAVLAGIVQCPNKYCPLIAPLTCERRRNQIFSKMVAVGFISHEQKDIFVQEPLLVQTYLKNKEYGQYAKEVIRTFLEAEFKKGALYTDGLVVQTTINSAMQCAAEQAFEVGCKEVQERLLLPINGALICVDNESVGIKALVGGLNFGQSQFNRAFQARRQLGSIIKPFVYATAFEHGLQPFETEIDEPIEVIYDAVCWKPNNYDKKFRGMITRAYALSCSNNIVTIKTLLKTGIDPLLQLLKSMDLEAEIVPYPSLALGCIDVTPKEAVGMFTLFARKGLYKKPHLISWVKDRWGKKIYKQEHVEKQIIPWRIADQVAALLMIGTQRLKKIWGKDWLSCQVLGKTGTTNDSRTCWFAGSTPSYTTLVYMGCDDNSSMGKNVFPIKTAFPVWFNFHKSIQEPMRIFSYHRSLKEEWINKKTGELVSFDDPEAIRILV